MAKIISITPENVRQEGLFCIKDLNSPGFKSKEAWYTQQFSQGLCMQMLKDENGKSIGFIEYTPAEMAWRPIQAPNYLFIHCLMIYGKANQGHGNGKLLLQTCEKEALEKGLKGVCVMTSKGSWIASKSLFERNGYLQVDKKGRFELMAKKFEDQAPDPSLLDWEAQQNQYQGWHMIYADQCPWHEKAIEALSETAREFGVELQITKLNSAAEAKLAPSGFGVFSLIHDGKLLEDHYISTTRLKNILKKELG